MPGPTAKKAHSLRAVPASTGGDSPTRVRVPRRPPWASPFLESLRRLGVVASAASTAGVSRAAPYKLRDRDAGFAAEMQDALAESVEVLEAEAWRRATTGVAEPVFNRGEVVGHVTRYSDQLLITLLKGHHPGRYREKYEVSSSVTMAAVQGKIDRVVAAVLKVVKDPALLDRLQAEFERIDEGTR